MFCLRAILCLLAWSACPDLVLGQQGHQGQGQDQTNVFTMRPISTIYLPHDYTGAGGKAWGLNRDAAVKTAYDMETKLAYSAGKKWIHVVDFAEIYFPKILDKYESATKLTDIAECGNYVAWSTEGEHVTDPGYVFLFDKFSRMSRTWTQICEFSVGAKPKSIKFTKDCATILVANEGEAATKGRGRAQTWENPEGSVSIIRLYGRNGQPNNGRNTGRHGRMKRQFPPPPQSPRWAPQQPIHPQTPARPPGRFPGRVPGRVPGRTPGTPAYTPPGHSPNGGVITTRGTCQGGGGFVPIVTTMDFTKFNPRAALYTAALVRHPYRGQMGDRQPNTFSQGLEPEYITMDEMETTAFVSLQENNAIASINIGTNEVMGIHPLGAKQWKRFDLDASQLNGLGFMKYDIQSFRQPDAIETYTASNGETYIVTANEGKQLEYTCGLNACPPGGGEFVEFEKGDEFPEDYWLTAQLLQRVSNEELLDRFRLGDLEFSRIDGRSTVQPLKHDDIYFYGGRGISVYRVNRDTGNLTLAWDSGDIIEKATAKYFPEMHNSNNRVGDLSLTPASTFDSWSDQRGPECESLAIGDVEGTKLIFVGIDRVSAIAIFSVAPGQTTPVFESIHRDGYYDQSFSQLYRKRRIGDSDPESLVFIPPSKSLDRRPYLMVTGRVSGSISMYQIKDEPRWMLLRRNHDIRIMASRGTVVLSTILAIVAGWRRLL